MTDYDFKDAPRQSTPLQRRLNKKDSSGTSQCGKDNVFAKGLSC